MAATAYLQLRPRHRAIQNPRFLQFFSSSSSSTPDPPNADPQNTTTTTSPPPPPSQSSSSSSSSSSFSSYFSDVKSSLKQQSPPPQQQQQHQPRKSFYLSNPPHHHQSPNPSKVASLEEIRKNLAEFRHRAAAPSPPQPAAQHISFQELYKRNVTPRAEDSSPRPVRGSNPSFETIRMSLRQLGADKSQADGGGDRNKVNPTMSLSKYTETLKLRPVDPGARESPSVIGRNDVLPSSVFGREMRERGETETPEMKTEFLKMYSYGELGDKLRRLRPEAKSENWFSLGELNERLKRLRELEEMESESSIGGITFRDLRESLMKLKMSDDGKTKRSSIQRLDVLSQLGQTPNFMLAPPNEQLVEKYFHPDNMSSSEKMKIELQKVRDEFKMSESDCGSARVQVAQLTTKIKHLSTALHKKDKHSRKGLQEMVQRRKKLLKYLRRTDWDSYTLVLSKLGLRDNPTYKN